jgi:hypothetical protein
MALTLEELKKQNDLIKEGIELAKKLGLAADEASLKNFTGDLVQAERLVQSLRDEWKDYIKDIAGAREGFTRIFDEIKGINSGVNRTKNAFSGLTSLAAKLQNHVEGTNTLSTKELEKLKQQTQQRENDLKLAGKLAKDRVKELEAKAELSKKEKKDLREARIAHQNISQEITRNAGHLKQFNAQLDETIKASEKIDDNLGLAGKLIKDVGKLPIIGSFIDSAKVLEDATAAAGEEGATKASTMKAAFKSAGGSLKENLMDPTAMTLGLMKMMWETLMGADKATGDLAKSMNMTYDAASKTRQDLTRLSNSTLDASVNTLRLQESMVAIGNSLGTNAKLNEADLVTMTKLREKAGLTNEELIGMQKITLATGGNLEENTEQFLGSAKALSMQKGLAINVKQLMKETANTSNATKLSLVGGAKGLAEAAVQAKALGTSLDQVDKIAGSLLNFEDSISAELEAELLTGKQINLETARLAALNGDLATVAEEINNQIGGSAEFSKMNRIQQEAFAKSVGMSREELANSLVEQEALAAIGRDLSKEEQAAYEAAKKQYGEKEAAKMLAEGQLEDMMHQQSIQERLNDSMEKMKEVLVSIADPLLQMISPIVDILQPALMGINMVLGAIGNAFSFIGEKVSAIIGPLGTVGKILKYVAGLAVVYAAYKAYASLATLPIVGVPLGIAAAAAVTTAGFGMLNSIKDGMIGPDGGLIVSGEKGTYQLDKDDTIVAGTDLGKSKSSSGGGSNVSIDYDRMASAIASAVAKVQINTSVKVNEREIASGVNTENNKSTSKLP